MVRRENYQIALIDYRDEYRIFTSKAFVLHFLSFVI